MKDAQDTLCGADDMTLVACTCPHCGGEVKMEDTLTTGYCVYCGRQIINDKAVVGDINVRMDRTSDVVNLLRLAKYSMYDGDLAGAQVLLRKAMQMDANNADVWYMDAVFDKKNAKNDVIRARGLKSYGVFSEKDMEDYSVLTHSGGQNLLMIFGILTFFATFFSIPFAVVFEKYYLIPLVMFIGIVLMACAVVYINNEKRLKVTIPSPRTEMDPETEKAIKKEVEDRTR